MGKASSTYRVIEILKALNEGKILSIDTLASAYDTSARSIRRDFELIKEIFGDILISPQKGCYQAVGKTLLQDTLNSTELYMLKNILKLSDKSQLSLSKTVDDTVKKAIIKEEDNSPYLFKNKPYEEIYEHKEKFRFLEHAITFRKEIRFTYRNVDKVNVFTLKPYKILFISENFYLASEYHYKSKKVTLSRIAMIEDLQYTGQSFNHDREMMEFIYHMQSPWATYKENFKHELKEIIVQVPHEQAKYFKLKKFLPSQKILSEDEEGALTLSYTVSSQNEVITLIKQWIPHMKVIAPESLVWMMKGVAKKYLGSFEKGDASD